MNQDVKIIIEEGNLKGLKKLNFDDHSINRKDGNGNTLLHLAVIEHLDGLASKNRPGEEHRSHVRTAPRSVHSKKAQSCSRQPIQMAIGMSHQFVGLLGGRIETHRVIHRLLLMKRQVAIATIYRATRGIHQVLHSMITTSLKDVTEAHQIGLNVGRRILQ